MVSITGQHEVYYREDVTPERRNILRSFHVYRTVRTSALQLWDNSEIYLFVFLGEISVDVLVRHGVELQCLIVHFFAVISFK